MIIAIMMQLPAAEQVNRGPKLAFQFLKRFPIQIHGRLTTGWEILTPAIGHLVHFQDGVKASYLAGLSLLGKVVGNVPDHLGETILPCYLPKKLSATLR